MTQTQGDVSVDVHHLGAEVKLLCSTGQHNIGHLRRRSNATIEYWPREGEIQEWPPHDKWGPVTWWTVRCPDGCPKKFGGPVDIIRQIVNQVGDDPRRTEGRYTLTRAES
jgi:hypothetical protein